MKAPILLFSSLVILVTNLLVASAANDKVLDIDGQELRTGTNYYVLPLYDVGGLSPTGTSSSQCPVDVVEGYTNADKGKPVKFTPVNRKEPTIRESQDLNIEFSDALCAPLNVWRLNSTRRQGAAPGEVFVSTGGVVGNPGGATISNWFRIEKLDGGSNWYKLVYCPRVCNTCRPVCGDLGIVQIKNGNKHLVLKTGDPFQVFFKKA